MDFWDQASMQEEKDREDALARQRARFAALTLPEGTVDTARVCLSCGDDIPEERRLAVPGTMLCTACQVQEEHNQKLRR